MAGIFDGLKVIDFTNIGAGPGCTTILADFGAEVIKIEQPLVGDNSRHFPPFIRGQALSFFWMNRGKKSVTLALDDPINQEILYMLISESDVVVESFKPESMQKFNLGYEL